MARSHTAKRLRWSLAGLGVASVVLVGYTGHQALTAKTNLQLVAADFSTLSGQLTSGDQTGAEATLVRARSHARSARDSTTGPGWWLTSRIPGVGRNIVAVRTVADVADELSDRVLPDVLRASSALRPEALRPHGGRVDLAPITRAEPAVVRADARLTRSARRVAAIRTQGLAPQIAQPIVELQQKLAAAETLSDHVTRAVRLLPPMLGADGPRTYLLMVQNNAEIRATGGIPGSFAVIEARHGTVGVRQQADASRIGAFDRPVTRLTATERSLFGDHLASYPQDVTFTPDFARSARIARAMWKARHGVAVDGVVSADPVALSYLLRGTGPVALADGRSLSAEDAVQQLLSRVYAEIADPAAQNRYFDSVARSVFAAVASGQGKPQVVLDGLAAAAAQRRVLVWSAHPDEQALLAPTTLGGLLPTAGSTVPDVGIYLNDGGGSKLDYYLDYDVGVASRRCQATRQYLDVTVHLKSRVPADPSGLPDYVAANVVGIPRGVIRTTLLAYAPVGGRVEEASVDGHAVTLDTQDHDGRPVAAQTIDLAPGSRHTLTYRMVTGRGQTARTRLQVTPGVGGDGSGRVGEPSC